MAQRTIPDKPREQRISTKDVRNRLGDLLNRVALRRDVFVIERKGEPMAALVPVDFVERLRLFERARENARRDFFQYIDSHKSAPDTELTEDEVMRFAVEQVRAVRQEARRTVLEFFEEQRRRPGPKLTDDEAMKLALELQREVREEMHKEKQARKRSR
ncbi:type II toxin-antitoxin system Phd/YefM family antitoxin [bacterium]|nr:type II toxin-antitoxin system Phd/YefM family antitoxin [bacterium]